MKTTEIQVNAAKNAGVPGSESQATVALSASLYERLTATLKPEDITSHYSDLYVRYTPEAAAIIAEWKRETGKTGWGMCSFFVNQVEGGQWIDIPFAFDPYWNKALSGN